MRHGFAEIVVGVLTRPQGTLRRVGEGGSLGPALIALVLVAIVTGWSSALAFPGMAGLLGGPILLVPATIMIGGMLLLLQAGVCYGLARLFGSHGSFRGLFSGLALANVPSVFQAPFALLAVILGPVGMTLNMLGTVALSIWAIVLGVMAVRETFITSTGRAALIYFLPLVLLLGLAVAVLVIGIL